MTDPKTPPRLSHYATRTPRVMLCGAVLPDPKPMPPPATCKACRDIVAWRAMYWLAA